MRKLFNILALVAFFIILGCSEDKQEPKFPYTEDQLAGEWKVQTFSIAGESNQFFNCSTNDNVFDGNPLSMMIHAKMIFSDDLKLLSEIGISCQSGQQTYSEPREFEVKSKIIYGEPYIELWFINTQNMYVKEYLRISELTKTKLVIEWFSTYDQAKKITDLADHYTGLGYSWDAKVIYTR